jgi:2-furoyl-CoA dehydrogenase 2Fe-2S iron sulfur subunit
MRRYAKDGRHRVRLTLNGREREGWCESRMLLSDFLRQALGATGTHVGCEHGVCGACTVRFDGEPARACLTLAVQADGRAGRDGGRLWPDETGRLTDLQEAFVATTRCNAVSARRGY